MLGNGTRRIDRERKRERGGDGGTEGFATVRKKKNRAKEMRARGKKGERDTEETERNKTSRGVALALSGG